MDSSVLLHYLRNIGPSGAFAGRSIIQLGYLVFGALETFLIKPCRGGVSASILAEAL